MIVVYVDTSVAEFLSLIHREKIDPSIGIDYLKKISLIIPDRSISLDF